MLPAVGCGAARRGLDRLPAGLQRVARHRDREGVRIVELRASRGNVGRSGETGGRRPDRGRRRRVETRQEPRGVVVQPRRDVDDDDRHDDPDEQRRADPRMSVPIERGLGVLGRRPRVLRPRDAVLGLVVAPLPARVNVGADDRDDVLRRALVHSLAGAEVRPALRDDPEPEVLAWPLVLARRHALGAHVLDREDVHPSGRDGEPAELPAHLELVRRHGEELAAGDLPGDQGHDGRLAEEPPAQPGEEEAPVAPARACDRPHRPDARERPTDEPEAEEAEAGSARAEGDDERLPLLVDARAGRRRRRCLHPL